MLENIKFGLFAVLPLLLMMVVGYVFRAVGFLKKDFFLSCDKLVFHVALPLLLFYQMLDADFSTAWNTSLLLYVCIGSAISFIAVLLIIPFFIRTRTDRGAFCQGCVRSNYSIVGLPLALNLFGTVGHSTAALIMPFLIPIYNVLAVLILTVNAPGEKKGFFGTLFKVCKGIITNPLILAMAAGALVKYFDVTIPTPAASVMRDLGALAMPLALMSLGATFEFSALKGKISLALVSSLIKTVLLPALAVIGGILFGFRGMELGIIFIIFGGPTSVSSYAMAAEMRSNRDLAGQIVVLSSVLSMFTIFFGAFLLRSLSLI